MIPITVWNISNETESLFSANAIVVNKVIKKPTDRITVVLLLCFADKKILYHSRCL